MPSGQVIKNIKNVWLAKKATSNFGLKFVSTAERIPTDLMVLSFVYHVENHSKNG